MAKFDVTNDLQDLTGKVVVVTGANKGVGFSVVKHLLRKNAKVYLGSRSETNAKNAIASLKQQLEQERTNAGSVMGEVIWLPIDLSDPSLVKKAAQEVMEKEKRLDVLVNNAAVLWETYNLGKDGISNTMMVNYVSQVVFTESLLPLLKKTAEEPNADVRIVMVSSGSHDLRRARDPNLHFRSVEDLNNEYKEDFLSPFSRYCVSKLALLLYTNLLKSRLSSSSPPILVISAHPGPVYTFEDRASMLPLSFITKRLMRLFMVTPDVGAYNPVFAAASPKVKEQAEQYNGSYTEPVGKVAKQGVNARRDDLRDELWETTKKVIEKLGLGLEL